MNLPSGDKWDLAWATYRLSHTCVQSWGFGPHLSTLRFWPGFWKLLVLIAFIESLSGRGARFRKLGHQCVVVEDALERNYIKTKTNKGGGISWEIYTCNGKWYKALPDLIKLHDLFCVLHDAEHHWGDLQQSVVLCPVTCPGCMLPSVIQRKNTYSCIVIRQKTNE